jgi:hypothetical protein
MSACVQCGQQFNCGMADIPATEPCWCMSLPPLPPALLASAGDAARCFCPTCLQDLLDRHLSD